MIVLMLLYPVVVLFNKLVQSPLLIGFFGLPLWGALFIGNAVSVVLLSLLVPWSSRRLDWWLSPSDREPKTEVGGAALVVGIYVLCLLMAPGRSRDRELGVSTPPRCCHCVRLWAS